MATYLQAWADALYAPIQNVFCANLVNSVDRLLVGTFTPQVGGPGYTNPIMAPFLVPDTCTPAPIAERPNFIGGQCPDVLYTVNTSTVLSSGEDRPFQFVNIVGPITGIGNYWERDFFGVQFAGIVLFAPRNAGPPPGQARFGTLGPPDPSAVTRSRILSIVRQDGQPDNCGNPPGPIPPTPPPSFGPFVFAPFNFFIAGFGNINVTGNLVFRPAINIPISGGVHIPVDVTINANAFFSANVTFPVYLRFPSLTINTGISFNNNLDITPQINFPRRGSDLPTVRRIIGVNVVSTITQNAPITIINGNNGAPNLNAPRLAIVRFNPPAAISNRQSIDIDVKTLNQFVPVPWFYGAESFTVLNNVGVSTVATPVFGNIADLVQPG